MSDWDVTYSLAGASSTLSVSAPEIGQALLAARDAVAQIDGAELLSVTCSPNPVVHAAISKLVDLGLTSAEANAVINSPTPTTEGTAS